jgi:hypothetical protein|uniref:RING-type domain-containing protein n=1 Tax=viral metagenome TaxID=1070528 RepID=A0A6C0D995_9ZZZZ
MINSSFYVIPSNNINMNHNRRKCSFCHCEGHNITTCNSNILSSVNNYLIYLKEHFTNNNDGNRILAIKDFENYLYDYCNESENNIKLLKYIACRFYNTRLRSMLQIVINQIILRLYDIDINWVSFHEYNFVPFNEHTPVRISYVLNGILLNHTNALYNNLQESNSLKNYEFELEKCQENTSIECSICYNTVQKINCGSFKCKHEYCIDCIEQLVNKKHTSCPYCREEIKNITCYNEEYYNKLTNNNLP